jgi:hypothetical protein
MSRERRRRFRRESALRLRRWTRRSIEEISVSISKALISFWITEKSASRSTGPSSSPRIFARIPASPGATISGAMP